jgi:hypothetical protein
VSRPVKLREIAHARAGDKGNRSNVSVFVYDPAHYDAVARALTPQRLRESLGALVAGDIRRYDLPGLCGFNLVMDEALEGGVNRSLNLDGHGKSWSALLLGIEVDLA